MSNVTSPRSLPEGGPEDSCPHHIFGAYEHCSACRDARLRYDAWVNAQMPEAVRITRYYSPLTATQVEEYAQSLRVLLRALDWEIVAAAFVGERESDLLDSVRKKVDGVRELLNLGVPTGSQPTDLRGRGLAVLDSFTNDLESAAGHDAPFYKPLGGVGFSGVPDPTQAISLPSSTAGTEQQQRRSRLAEVVDRVWFALVGRRGRRSA